MYDFNMTDVTSFLYYLQTLNKDQRNNLVRECLFKEKLYDLGIFLGRLVEQDADVKKDLLSYLKVLQNLWRLQFKSLLVPEVLSLKLGLYKRP